MAVWRAFAQPLRYAALGAGALPVLAFPQLNLEFLGWCGLVPGILIVRGSPSAREAAVRGWWLGAGFLLAVLYWLAPSIGPALLLVAAVFGALWTGFGVAAWALLRAPLSPARTLAALAVLPSYWVLTEWARSWQGFGGPWGVLGTSQWQHPAVLALAAAGGVWLISFVLAAANTGIVVLLVARRMAVRVAGAAGVAVALAAGPAAFALSATAPAVRHVTVALVQPGITPSKGQRADASLRLSGRLRGARPDLVVWGESSVGTDIERQPVLFSEIRRVAAATGAQVLVNQDASGPDGSRSKVALLIGPHGLAGSYTKTRLVPFGEYIPLRGALGWIARISRAAPSNMVPGDGAHLVHATDRLGRPLPLGVLICFESAFPDMSRVDADLRAQLIVYQTSDSTFQRSWAPAQHASLSAVRAAETGRPVVQAALTGDSVAFDARGRLLALMTARQRGVTVVRLDLPPAATRTAYDRLGDYVPWAATGIAAVAAIAGFLIVRRARGGRVPWDGNPRRVRSVSTVGASPGKSGKASAGSKWSATGGSAVRQSDRADGQRHIWAGRQGRSAGPGRWLAVTGVAGLLIAACSSGSPTPTTPAASHSAAKASAAAVRAQLHISPGDGHHEVNPSKGIKVTAASGKIQTVSVTSGHQTVGGSFNGAHTVWRNQWALQPSRNYTVRATAVNSSGTGVTSTSSFHTLTPAASDTAMIFEGYKQSYGVGIPIRITFSSPVTNKAAVEKSLQVSSSKPVTGAWYWDGNQTLYFRTMNYWPANTTVSFNGHLDGVEASPGVFFTADLTQTFDIGPSLVVVASTKTHYLNVFYQGKLWGHWPISTGRPGLDTVDGTYITLEKGNPVRMVGNGYNELVNDAVRFTYSGDYLHSAPWSVGEQGSTNVSHGCVNLSPQHAAMYYNLAVPGEPVTVTGSPHAGKWGDGFTVWFLSWKQLLKGSALGQAVQVTSSGSTFVSPSSVTATPQLSRLAGPKPDNYAAQS